MEGSPITGGCYCGKLRFRASGPTLHQANCHCANCRRAAGAQSVAWITVKLSEFGFDKGEPKRYKTDTGAYRTFCDACGTSLTYENDERPNEIDITTGSLDDPERFPPNRDVYPEEKLSWVRLVDGSFRHP
jgi:hypothetical protein